MEKLMKTLNDNFSPNIDQNIQNITNITNGNTTDYNKSANSNSNKAYSDKNAVKNEFKKIASKEYLMLREHIKMEFLDVSNI